MSTKTTCSDKLVRLIPRGDANGDSSADMEDEVAWCEGLLTVEDGCITHASTHNETVLTAHVGLSLRVTSRAQPQTTHPTASTVSSTHPFQCFQQSYNNDFCCSYYCYFYTARFQHCEHLCTREAYCARRRGRITSCTWTQC